MKNLRPVPVAPSGALTFICAKCGKQANQSHGIVYADHDAPPLTYYCAVCAFHIQTGATP